MRRLVVPISIAALTLITLFPVKTVPGCPGNLDDRGVIPLILCPDRARTALGLTYAPDVHPISAVVISLLIAGALAISAWSFGRLREQERPGDA